MPDEDPIYQRLRDTPASWEKATPLSTSRMAIDRTNIRKWEPVTFTTVQSPTTIPPVAAVPGLTVTAATEQANEYSFELEVDSIDTDAGDVDIHIGYGEINDIPPAGMTGADDYVITISVDGTEIWAVITYDPDTLLITSRSLAFGPAVLPSTLGILNVPVGFVDINYDPMTGKIIEVNPHNRQCGDINVAFVYGAQNGARALIPLRMYADWVPVP